MSPISSLLASLFGVTIDNLLREDGGQSIKNKRGPASKLQQRFEQVSTLPRSKQKFITDMLDVLIKQQQSV